MLIQFGAGVLDARGSIGGTTYSRNSSGAYARARVTPVNPNTSRQALIRNVVQFLAQNWSSTLTLAMRNAWAAYALAINRQNKLGQVIKLSGFNHYVRCNSPRLQAIAAAVTAGPTDLTLPETDPTFTPTISEATQNLSVVFNNALPWANETGGYMLVSVSAPHAPGRNFIGGPFRYAGKIAGVTGTPPTSPATVASPWPLAEGQKVAVQARVSRADGRLSDPFRIIVAVVA